MPDHMSPFDASNACSPPPSPGHNPQRRHYPRFTPKKTIFVFHHDFGQVANISMGGLLYLYQMSYQFTFHKTRNGSDNHHDETETGVLFFANDDFIDNLPFITISDAPASSFRSRSAYDIRKRRISFGKLTENQIDKLERLLLKHVEIPQLTEMPPTIA